MRGRGTVRRRCGLGQDFSELKGGGETRAERRRGLAYLGFALGSVLSVHARVQGDAVEAGRLREGRECARETGESDELVVSKRGHGLIVRRRERA